jgi:hypothetical protein
MTEDSVGSLERYAADLANAVESALPGWVERSVDRVMAAWRGATPAETADAAARAGRQASAEIAPAVRAVLEADIDEQRTTPLAVVRTAVSYPTSVLAAAGAPPVERDSFAIRSFPDDAYDLTPASWVDVDPNLESPGLAWGAAKAFEHRRRHGGTAPKRAARPSGATDPEGGR